MSEPAVVDTPVVEESFEAYVTRANAAEQTGTPLDETPAEPVAVVAEPVAEALKPKAKPRNDPQARIDEITAKHKEAERKASDAEARAARLEADLAATRTAKPAAQPIAAAAPATFPEYGAWASQPGNEGKPYEDYIDARTDWRYDQRQRAERQTQQERQAVQSLTESNTKFKERFTAALADEPNFLDTVDPRLTEATRISAFAKKADGTFYDRSTGQPLEPPTFVNFLTEQIFKSDAPKALLRHLSNAQEVQRLATLPPDEVIRILAKVEATAVPAAASRGSAPEPKKSAAPDPLQPLGSSAVMSGDEPSDDEPFEHFVRRENAKDRKAGRL